MADIFISYANADRDLAAALAKHLEATGFSLWWDKNLAGGARYEAEIDAELEAAKVVLVCWSAAAVQSDWVRSEADAGRRDSKLVCMRFDDAVSPRPFDRYHVEDLSGWKGALDTPALLRLTETLRAKCENRAAQIVSRKKQWLTRGAIIAAVTSGVAFIGWGASIINPMLTRQRVEQSSTATQETLSEIKDAILSEIRMQAAAAGTPVDLQAEQAITAALNTLVDRGEAEKQEALELARKGDLTAASANLEELANTQEQAAEKVRIQASDTYVEAAILVFYEDPERAIALYQKAFELNPQHREIWLPLGVVSLNIGEFEEARRFFTNIIEADPPMSPDIVAQATHNLSIVVANDGDYDRAISMLTEAERSAATAGDKVTAGVAALNQGKFHRYAGEPTAGQESLLRAEINFTELADQYRLGETKSFLGMNAFEAGDYDAAARYFQSSADLFQSAGALQKAIDANGVLADAFDGKEDFAGAQLAILKALELLETIDDPEQEIGLIIELGDRAADRRYSEEAAAIYERAGERAEETNDIEGVVQSLAGRAHAAEIRRDLGGALEFYEQALALDEANGLDRHAAYTLLNIGRLHLRLGALDAAQSSYVSAETLAAAIDNDNYAQMAREGLERVNRRRENEEVAE